MTIMHLFPLNLVKTHIIDFNESIEQKKIASAILESIKKSEKSVETSPLLWNDLMDHISKFKPVLKEIENLNINLTDRFSYNMLYKKSLERLMQNTPSTSLEYYTSLFDIKTSIFNKTKILDFSADSMIYKQTSDTFNTLSNEPIRLFYKFKTAMDSDYVILLNKVGSNTADMNSLTDFITNNSMLASQCLKHGKCHVANIENLPEYKIATDRMSMFFEQFEFSELYSIQWAILDSSNFVLHQAILHPYIVSVLGNALFLKILLPIATRSFNMSTQKVSLRQNKYNYPSNWEKFISKSLFKALSNKSYTVTISELKKKETLALVSSTVPLLGLMYKLFTNNSQPIPNPTPSQKEPLPTVRKLINDIPKPKLFEGYLGNATAVTRDLLGRASAEYSKTAVHVYNSFLQGALSESRETPEKVADVVDAQIAATIESRENNN